MTPVLDAGLLRNFPSTFSVNCEINSVQQNAANRRIIFIGCFSTNLSAKRNLTDSFEIKHETKDFEKFCVCFISEKRSLCKLGCSAEAYFRDVVDAQMLRGAPTSHPMSGCARMAVTHSERRHIRNGRIDAETLINIHGMRHSTVQNR